jgi:hypothetical protein
MLLRLVPATGTEVSFTVCEAERNVGGEQFWGRAVRASQDSKGSGALLIFGCKVVGWADDRLPLVQTFAPGA